MILRSCRRAWTSGYGGIPTPQIPGVITDAYFYACSEINHHHSCYVRDRKTISSNKFALCQSRFQRVEEGQHPTLATLYELRYLLVFIGTWQSMAGQASRVIAVGIRHRPQTLFSAFAFHIVAVARSMAVSPNNVGSG